MSWEHVVNLAEAGWKVVEENKPSADLDRSTANAVPEVDDWQALTGTQGPARLVWRYRFVNYLGETAVDIQFDLKWEYAARYRGGGAFIPNCWLSVPTCDVHWMFSVDLALQARNPTNAGTDAAPNARLPISVYGTVSYGPFWTDNHQWDFTLYGNGQWEQH